MPALIVTSKLDPSSDETVCVTASLFVTVIVLPAVAAPTVNCWFRIEIESALAPAPLAPFLLLLHAESATASRGNGEDGEEAAGECRDHAGTYAMEPRGVHQVLG